MLHMIYFPDLFSKLESFQALHHVEDLPSHGDECLGAEIDTKVVVVSGFAFCSFFCWQSEKLVDKLWGLWMLSTGSFWCGPRNLPGAPKMRQFSIEGLESTAFTLSITSSTEILFKLMISFLFDLMMFCGFLSVWKRETHGFQVRGLPRAASKLRLGRTFWRHWATWGTLWHSLNSKHAAQTCHSNPLFLHV